MNRSWPAGQSGDSAIPPTSRLAPACSASRPHTPRPVCPGLCKTGNRSINSPKSCTNKVYSYYTHFKDGQTDPQNEQETQPRVTAGKRLKPASEARQWPPAASVVIPAHGGQREHAPLPDKARPSCRLHVQDQGLRGAGRPILGSTEKAGFLPSSRALDVKPEVWTWGLG